MRTVAEIEAEIEQLPAAQVEELARWIEVLRTRRGSPAPAEAWLASARGVATPGVTTAGVMDLTRGEDGVE